MIDYSKNTSQKADPSITLFRVDQLASTLKPGKYMRRLSVKLLEGRNKRGLYHETVKGPDGQMQERTLINVPIPMKESRYGFGTFDIPLDNLVRSQSGKSVHVRLDQPEYRVYWKDKDNLDHWKKFSADEIIAMHEEGTNEYYKNLEASGRMYGKQQKAGSEMRDEPAGSTPEEKASVTAVPDPTERPAVKPEPQSVRPVLPAAEPKPVREIVPETSAVREETAVRETQERSVVKPAVETRRVAVPETSDSFDFFDGDDFVV